MEGVAFVNLPAILLGQFGRLNLNDLLLLDQNMRLIVLIFSIILGSIVLGLSAASYLRNVIGFWPTWALFIGASILIVSLGPRVLRNSTRGDE